MRESEIGNREGRMERLARRKKEEEVGSTDAAT
jgi:hypothetical protein